MNEIKFNASNLEDLVNGLQDLVYVTDPKRRIIYANKAFADIFRYSDSSKIIGMNISDLYVVKEHRTLFENSMKIREGRVVNYFVYVQRSTKEPFYLSVDSNWIDNNENKGIEGTGRDLTELVDFIGAFFQINLQGTLTFCSSSYARAFNYPGPEFLIGRNIQDLLLDTRSFVEICEQSCKEPNNVALLKAIRCNEENISLPMLLKMNVSPIAQVIREHEKIVGYQGTFEDVTATEQTRVALEESHRILELLTAKSQDGVYVIQGENLTLVSPAFCSIVERNKEKLLGIPYLELIHPDDRERVHQEVQRKLAGEERPTDDFRIITGIGKERFVRAFSGPCTIRQITSVYGYLRDITAELQREKELTQKIEERTRNLKEALDYQKALLATVVHEMDAPTVAIRGIVERLVLGITKETMISPKQLMKLGDIDELCNLILMLKKNLILAESEEVKITENIKCCHLENELINKAVNFMKPYLRNKGLPLNRIQVYLRGIPSYIMVDEDLFLQVFFNLLSNAIKYADIEPELFKIEIKSNYSESRGLILYFSDWGIGIPVGESKTIFEKRKKGSNTINSPGMGLGLWVAKRILTAYGCTIWVERRQNPTTFAIKFPVNLLSHKLPEGVMS